MSIALPLQSQSGELLVSIAGYVWVCVVFVKFLTEGHVNRRHVMAEESERLTCLGCLVGWREREVFGRLRHSGFGSFYNVGWYTPHLMLENEATHDVYRKGCSGLFLSVFYSRCATPVGDMYLLSGKSAYSGCRTHVHCQK